MSDSQRWLKTATYIASSTKDKGKKGVYVAGVGEDEEVIRKSIGYKRIIQI